MNQTCPHFGTCGGCQLLDQPYLVQLQTKLDLLKKLFGPWIKIEVPPVIASPQHFYYRHKVQLPFGVARIHGGERATLGCYANNSHLVVDQKKCLVQDKDLSHIAWTIREWAEKFGLAPYNESTGQGFLRHVLLRKGSATGEILVGLVTNGDRPKSSNSLAKMLLQMAEPGISSSSKIVGIVQNVNMRKTNVVLGNLEHAWWGRNFLKEKLGKFSFHLELPTFFQVNPFQTPQLYNEVLQHIEPGARVLDLYCGAGSIALWIAAKASECLGIEENRVSVAVARAAATANKVRNARFTAGDVSTVLNTTACDTFNTAIVDPPRKGLDPAVIEKIQRSGIRRLIYVSCNPESLANDIRQLSGPMELIRIQGVDMFPHTTHLECVAVLDRK